MRRALALLIPLVIAACSGAPNATVPPTAGPTTTAAASSPPPVTPSRSVGPTIAPSPSPAATPDPAPSEPVVDPRPTTPPLFDLATLTVDATPVPAALLGGCGSLWLGSEVYGSDSCGPWGLPYDADPMVVSPGGRLTFTAPDDFQFSTDVIEADPFGATLHAWEVTIASVDRLKALPEIDQNFVRVDQGATSLGYGDRAVISAWVTAPARPGEYVVQLAASVNTGAWTSTWPLFFWRVSVR